MYYHSEVCVSKQSLLHSSLFNSASVMLGRSSRHRAKFELTRVARYRLTRRDIFHALEGIASHVLCSPLVEYYNYHSQSAWEAEFTFHQLQASIEQLETTRAIAEATRLVNPPKFHGLNELCKNNPLQFKGESDLDVANH
ncbi:hypothetical protein CR513_07277, partial [Mucuna pruriens]